MGTAIYNGEPKDKAAEEGCLNLLTNKDTEKAQNNHNQDLKNGCLNPLTNKDTEKAQNNHNQDLKKGIWQKLKSKEVLLLRVLVGVLVFVAIVLPVLLSQRGETPETKVVNCSPAAVCEDDWVLYRGKCYYISDQIDTWTDSQNFCKSHDSSLAIIDNEKEKNFLNLLKANNYWIGLSRTKDESGWVWTDGTFYPKTLFDIHRKQVIPGESEHVYLNGDGFKSDGGRYLKKWICSKSFLGHSP